MIYHFLNCVSLFGFTPRRNDTLFVDSVSFRLCLTLNGINRVRESGLKFYESNRYNLVDNTLYLIDESKFEPNNRIYEGLPIFNCPDDLVHYNLTIPKEITSIVIGISSPKQDRLAQIISSTNSDIEIYCLGAAIYKENFPAIVDRLGLSWLYLGYQDPKRMVVKIYKTIVAFIYFTLTLKGRRKIKEVFEN